MTGYRDGTVGLGKVELFRTGPFNRAARRGTRSDSDRMTSTDGSLPYYFPKWSDRVGARHVSPWMRRVGPSLPGFAVVEHVGRKSGKAYETPVSVFRRGGVMAVVLLHGETQWAGNVVAAGEARLRCCGGAATVHNPRIVPPREAGVDVPRIARIGNRIAGVVQPSDQGDSPVSGARARRSLPMPPP